MEKKTEPDNEINVNLDLKIEDERNQTWKIFKKIFAVIGALAGLVAVAGFFGVSPWWNYYGEKEVAGELVLISKSPLEFPKAVETQDKLKTLVL